MRWYHLFTFMPQLEKEVSYLYENMFCIACLDVCASWYYSESTPIPDSYRGDKIGDVCTICSQSKYVIQTASCRF